MVTAERDRRNRRRAYDGGMPWNRRLPTHALRAMPRVVLLCAATALLGLALAACEETPPPRIATPSAIEVAVIQAAEAPSSATSAPPPRVSRQPNSMPVTAEPSAPARTATPLPPPRAPRQPSAPPSTTPTPPPAPLDDVVTARLSEAASLIENVSGSPAALQAGPDLHVLLESAVLEFLAVYGPDPEAAVRLDSAIGQLPPLVYELEPQGARVVAADVDGDSQNELIAAYHIIGVPPAWFDQGETGFTAHAFPVGAAAESVSSMTAVHSTADLTDDGAADVLLVSTTPGVSTQTEAVRVYTWDDETPRRVFDVAVVLGSGPAGWELRDATAPAEIETVCPAMGHFDAPLLPHPGLRRTFAWDGAWFREVARRVDPPVSPHDQINRAETAFWAGRYADAEAGYLAVLQAPLAAGDSSSAQPDWEGLAHLRLAQIALIQGQFSDPARLRTVIERGGAIGLVGQALQSTAANPDPLPTFAALQTLNLSSEPPPGAHGSIGFPMEHALVLALGKALEIGLRGVGSAELSANAIVDRLGSGGVRIRSVAVGDLNRDGALEAVVSIPRNSARVLGPPQNEFWFVSRVGTRWVAHPVPGIGVSAVAAGVRDVSEGRSVFAITEPASAREFYLGFDGRLLDVWTRLPTLHDLYPANPFDGREISRCEIGL